MNSSTLSNQDVDYSALFDATCVLYANSRPIPLQSQSIKAKVLNFVSKVKVTQVFVNNDTCPIEAIFTFKQEDCCPYGLEADINGTKLKAYCKEKQEAQNIYDDSISSGNTAFLLEKTDQSSNSFKMNLGNLQPGNKAIITLKYLCEFYAESDYLKLEFPIARYSCENNNLDVDIDIQMTSEIDKIEMISPHVAQITNNGKIGNVKYISKDSNAPNPLKPFRVLLRLKKSENSFHYKPQITIQESKITSKRYGMLSFHPDLKTLYQNDDFEPRCEMVFVLDQSGSMSGPRIRQAKNALILFLRSLPEGCIFNIYGFGTNFHNLFTTSQNYTEKTFNQAINWVKNLDSDLGGTELLNPLKIILENKIDKYPKQIFILTDGDVTNRKEVIEFVKIYGKEVRIFTLGIGCGASQELVVGLAKAGRGMFEFVLDGNRFEKQVLKQLQRGLEPILKNVKIIVGEKQIEIGNVFSENKIIVFWEMEKNEEKKKLENIKFLGNISEGKNREIEIEIETHEMLEKKGELLKRIMGWKRITEIEQNQSETPEEKEEAIKLSVDHQLLSKYTSFISVIENTESTQQAMKQVNITPDRVMLQTEREQDILNIQRDVRDIQNIFKEITQIVDEQCCSLDLIESNVTRSSQNVSVGATELLQARSFNQNSWKNWVSNTFEKFTPNFFNSKNSFEKNSISSLDIGDTFDDSLIDIPVATSGSDARDLDTFLNLQMFKGSWDVSKQLCELGKLKYNEVVNLKPSSISSEVWGTVIALLILKTIFVEAQEEWLLISNKSERWLQNELKNNKGINLNDLFALAKQLFA